MTAQRLRDAARILRERATAATPGPWYVAMVGEIDDKWAHLTIASMRQPCASPTSSSGVRDARRLRDRDEQTIRDAEQWGDAL